MSADSTVDAFKNIFNINTDTSDVRFRRLHVEPYDALPQRHQFGEKVCLLYKIELTVFNININLRILAFKYENHAEVLKLEIEICNDLLSREMAPCKNFLQRRRNLNLTFEAMIKFAQLFETRRLVCLTVFQKNANVVTISEDGVVVKCCNSDFTIKYLELNWSLSWKVDSYEVSDFIEFYFNYSVFTQQCADRVKTKLEILVEPKVDFHKKLRLWRSVMFDLYGNVPQMSRTRPEAPKTTDVLEILDSDSDESVIEIDSGVDKSVYQGSNNDEVMVID